MGKWTLSDMTNIDSIGSMETLGPTFSISSSLFLWYSLKCKPTPLQSFRISQRCYCEKKILSKKYSTHAVSLYRIQMFFTRKMKTDGAVYFCMLFQAFPHGWQLRLKRVGIGKVLSSFRKNIDFQASFNLSLKLIFAVIF